MKRTHFVTTAAIVGGAICFLFGLSAAAQPDAQYTLTFTSTWSASTHPMDFPSNPHYSPLRGVTHNGSVSFWEDGTLASAGIKQMAETGNNTNINSEIAAAQTATTAENDIIGSGLSPSPGQLQVSFDINETHPLVTVVAMLAPSPDWFIGLNGVNLFDGGAWVTDTTFTLYAYDAGTDSGVSYASANDPTTPPVNISQITDGPFFVSGDVVPVGTIRFENTTPLSIQTQELEDGHPFLTGPYPNPVGGTLRFEITVEHDRRVDAAVFDLLGRKVATVHTGVLPQGFTEFDFDARGLSEGFYLLRVLTPSRSEVRGFTVAR